MGGLNKLYHIYPWIGEENVLRLLHFWYGKEAEKLTESSLQKEFLQGHNILEASLMKATGRRAPQQKEEWPSSPQGR